MTWALKRWFLANACLLFLSISAQAQDEWNIIEKGFDGPGKTEVTNPAAQPDVDETTFSSNIRSFDKAYTGYAVEVVTSEMRLTNSQLKALGVGRLYCRRAGDRYQYLIPISFNNRRAIKRFLKQVIRPKVPGARVVRFLNGSRTTTLKW